jgi:hypothetical protein
VKPALAALALWLAACAHVTAREPPSVASAQSEGAMISPWAHPPPTTSIEEPGRKEPPPDL